MSIPPSLRIVDVIPIYDHQLVHLFWGLRFLLACPELLLGNPLHLKTSPQFLKISLQLMKISLQHLKISLQPPAHEVLPLEKLFFSVFDDRLLLLCLFSEVITATIFLIKVVKICSMLQILMIFWLYTNFMRFIISWFYHISKSPIREMASFWFMNSMVNKYSLVLGRSCIWSEFQALVWFSKYYKKVLSNTDFLF